jgi:hypothetical protein
MRLHWRAGVGAGVRISAPHLTLMRPSRVKRQTTPVSGLFVFSALWVPAMSAVGLVG